MSARPSAQTSAEAAEALRALSSAGPDRADEAAALARQLIEDNPAHAVARFTPNGKATLGCLELAYDTLANDALRRAKTNEAVLEALSLAKAGLRLDHERPDWLINTTVRALIALSRMNDAFVLVEDALRRFPKTALFADLDEKRSAWREARTPAHDPRALTTAHQRKAHPDESFAEIINRANRWLRALYETGMQTLVEVAFGDASVAVKRVCSPISPSEVEALEGELGFSLPPSYARFLTEVGGVAWMGTWWDETTPPGELVEKSRRQAALDMPNDEAWRAAKPDLGLLRIASHHGGEDWIYLCHFRDHRGEAPTFLRYHDERELTYGPGLAELEAVVAGEVMKASPVGGGEAALAVELSAALEDEDLSQRDELKLITGDWAVRLGDASDEDLLAALHLVRRRIKSKRLREERDALIGALRRDGEAGDAPLPSLDAALRPKKEKAPTPPAPRFDSFHAWLSARVDGMMDEVVDAVAPPSDSAS